MNKPAQFTPGPWALEYDVDGIPLTIIGNDGSAIGTIETWNDHAEGNRHIITAAPAMYEALQIMVRAANVDEIDPLVMFASIERARHVLKLAEGKSA